MNKLNSKLVTVFLIFGTIFFLIFIYLLISKEFIKTYPEKLVSINNISIIKNQMPNDSHVFYHNLSIKNNIALDENEKTNMYKTKSCVFQLVKIKDNIVFAKSEEFNFENSKINNPFKVNFYDQNNSKIPAKFNDEEFKLLLLKDEKIIAEFPTGNLNNNLNLKHDEYSISPNTVIQLTSTNQKIDLLAEFQIH